MRLARRMDRHRFPLSPEARELIAREPGRWRLVELADGDAAQGTILGGTGRAPLSGLPVPEPITTADSEPPELQTPDLFNLET